MVFPSIDYVVFLIGIFGLYWLLRRRALQNPMLLIASYIFYGYVHPWYCGLMLLSSSVDYFAGLGMDRFPERKRFFLIASLVCNFSCLGWFKYFDFFVDSFHMVLGSMGLETSRTTLQVLLPAGISFYTFQGVSYAVDVYRGHLKACRNPIDFMLYISFFPQLVAGPIERAGSLLPQIQRERVWHWDVFWSAFPLLVQGYLKKLVIADNISPFVDKIFFMEHPPAALILAGGFGFLMQVYGDFAGYSDIARGSARLLGFELMVNFDRPYLSTTLPMYWRRWHISFSSWVREYVYIPLGGSHVKHQWQFFLVIWGTMCFSGLWHGASWKNVVWGTYHTLCVWGFNKAGLGSHWRPPSRVAAVLGWMATFATVIFGLALFRAPSTYWFIESITRAGLDSLGEWFPVVTVVVVATIFYSLPMFLLYVLDRIAPPNRLLHAAFYATFIAMTFMYRRLDPQPFVYFQF